MTRHAGDFTSGEWAREMGRRGAAAMHAKRKAAKAAKGAPYSKPFLTFLDECGLGGPTRAVWRVFWKAADGLPLDPDELQVFQQHTARTVAPTAPARECWVPAGRKGGKSQQMTHRATWRAIGTDWRKVLSGGEDGLIPIIAPDRVQSRNTLKYLKALATTALVAPYVRCILRDSVEFTTGATVRVTTASWRTTRGFTMLDVLLEECAFYRSDDSANPDEEILAAIRPAMLTVPGARVYGISSPHQQRGILFKAYQGHWGRDDSDVLVFSADSLSLNPTLSKAAIDREFEEDAAKALSEYGRDGRVQFRSDVEALFSPDAVRAVVISERRELPPVRGVEYHAFVDPSGGSVDSFTLAIAHRDGDSAVLDLVREIRAPLNPDAACEEISEVLPPYGISEVVGDRYAVGFTSNSFRSHGITYTASELTKSELYREMLAVVNSARCELLDVPRLFGQFLSLERRVARGGGKENIDHVRGAHDDLVNAVAGALVLASKAAGSNLIYAGGRVMNLLTGEGFSDPWENA